jgi:hypothetical protein
VRKQEDTLYRKSGCEAFPTTADAIFATDSFPRWLAESGIWPDDEHMALREHREELQKWQQILVELPPTTDAGGKERFDKLINELRNYCVGLLSQNIAFHLKIGSHPDPLPWPQYRSWHTVFRRRRTPERVVRALTDSNVDIEKRREFLRTLVRDRNQLLDAEISAIADTTRIQFMDQARAVTDDCVWLLKLRELFVEPAPVFDVDTVVEWINSFRHLSYFDTKYYHPIREAERQAALKVAEESASQALSLLEKMQTNLLMDTTSTSKPFLPTGRRIVDIWKAAVVRDAFNLFTVQQGIFRVKPDSIQGDLLFKKNSYLCTANTELKLTQLAEGAGSNHIVQENFVEYVRTVFGQAFEDGRAGALELLNEDTFRELLWKGACVLPINPRYALPLQNGRETFVKHTGKMDALPEPQWMKEYVIEYSAKHGNA